MARQAEIKERSNHGHMRGKNSQSKAFDPKRSLWSLRLVLPLLVGSFYAHNYLGQRAKDPHPITGPRLDLGETSPLQTYHEFRERYIREDESDVTETERSRRHLIFNGNLLATATHNLAFAGGSTTYLKFQSPFLADSTESEREKALDPQGQFNYAEVLEAAVRETASDRMEELVNRAVFMDMPVSQTLEKVKSRGRWLQWMQYDKSYFEVPNFPLDEQPDPDKITHIYKDWRNCTGAIKNQGECGACYAFSWMSLVEWHYCSQTGKLVDFSEQHMVDCGNIGIDGCTEGTLAAARSFSETYGLNHEKDYRYKAKKGICLKKKGKVEFKMPGWTRVKVERENWEKVLDEQPILADVKLPIDINEYSRGVHPGNNCGKSKAHGMLVVGYGSQNGVPYWLLRNSMGKFWGEKGYLRLSRDAPMDKCFRTSFIGKFKFITLPEENYHDFYDEIRFEPEIEPELANILKDTRMGNWLKRGNKSSETEVPSG